MKQFKAGGELEFTDKEKLHHLKIFEQINPDFLSYEVNTKIKNMLSFKPEDII